MGYIVAFVGMAVLYAVIMGVFKLIGLDENVKHI
jgi:hypothetical protein